MSDSDEDVLEKAGQEDMGLFDPEGSGAGENFKVVIRVR